MVYDRFFATFQEILFAFFIKALADTLELDEAGTGGKEGFAHTAGPFYDFLTACDHLFMADGKHLLKNVLTHTP